MIEKWFDHHFSSLFLDYLFRNTKLPRPWRWIKELHRIPILNFWKIDPNPKNLGSQFRSLIMIFDIRCLNLNFYIEFSVNFFDQPQTLTLIFINDRIALKNYIFFHKFHVVKIWILPVEDFPSCGVVWVRCLSSLKRWHTPRPLLLVERRIRGESANDSFSPQFPPKFRVQYINTGLFKIQVYIRHRKPI